MAEHDNQEHVCSTTPESLASARFTSTTVSSEEEDSLKVSFNECQDGSLKDYIEASLMLQYNKRDLVVTLHLLFLCWCSFLILCQNYFKRIM